MAMFGSSDMYSAPPFWSNGPTPGGLYNFPGSSSVCSAGDLSQRSQAPITTGTSVIGLVFDGGVTIAADILGSYGSLARFRDLTRVMKVNDNIILGAGGDYADFQYLKDVIEQKILEEECLDDGFALKPKSLYCWLTRVMYNRRSKFDPFWNNFVVGGLQDGEPFLGTVDKLGTAFEDKHIATGFGAYLAIPLLRQAAEANPNMSKRDAQHLLVKCLQILFYRDARSWPRYQIATITKDGVTVDGPLDLESEWEVAHMVKGY